MRTIGVSNFSKEDIDSLWKTAGIKPMVNQVLCHISNEDMNTLMNMEKIKDHGEYSRFPFLVRMIQKTHRNS